MVANSGGAEVGALGRHTGNISRNNILPRKCWIGQEEIVNHGGSPECRAWYTQKWKIILRTIGIDAKSGERIVDCRHAIYFRFSKIPVSGMKKGEQPPRPLTLQSGFPTI